MSRIPEVIPFEQVRGHQTVDCFWERVGVRTPKKGEWYLSGAIPMAYKAPRDLSTSYIVVKPTHFARTVQVRERGDRVGATA